MKLSNHLDFNSCRGTSAANGIADSDLATVGQVNAAIEGRKWKEPARAMADSAITLSGTQTVDGVALIVGDRCFRNSVTTPALNGIYVVAAGAWTRATDFDASAELNGASIFVSEGTTYGNRQYVLTTDNPITLGTTPLVFAQTNGGTSYTAGTGIGIAGSVISIDTTVVVRKAIATIGDGSATTISVSHGLNTQDVIVSVRDATTNVGVLCDWTANSTSTVQFTFNVAPASGAYKVVIMGAG